MPQPADRIHQMPEHVFVAINKNIAHLKSQGIDVVRLDIGNPDMPPPRDIIRELSRTANLSTTHGYSGYRGIAEFRQAVAGYYLEHFGVEVNPDTQILPLIGTKEGIANLTFAYISEGDVAIIPDVAYPTYVMATLLAGGEVKYVATDPSQLVIDLANINTHFLSRTKLLWVNYPNNPTGWTVSSNFYETLIEFCAKNDILLVSDNPYLGITYDDFEVPSLLQSKQAFDIGIEFFSLSKTYNMAGWRIGAAVGNADAIANLLKIKSNVDSGHFTPIYQAASYALNNSDDNWIKERNNVYKARRDKLVSVISDMGMNVTSPTATLYIWARVPAYYGDNDTAFVNDILEQAHVSLAPGSAYGPGGVGYVRIAVSASDHQIDEAIRRMSNWQVIQR